MAKMGEWINKLDQLIVHSENTSQDRTVYCVSQRLQGVTIMHFVLQAINEIMWSCANYHMTTVINALQWQ